MSSQAKEIYRLNQVFPVTEPASLNYIPRESVEQETQRGLARYSAVMLVGPSGVGKSSSLQKVLLTRKPSTVRTPVQLENPNFDDLLMRARNEILNEVLPWYHHKRIRENKLFGLVQTFILKVDLQRRLGPQLRDELLHLIRRHRVVWVIERAERLIEHNSSEQLVALLNDFREFSRATRSQQSVPASDDAAIVVCTWLPFTNAGHQTNRFATVNVTTMSDGEVRSMVSAGGTYLNVIFASQAIDKIVEVCCGSPLACSELVGKILENEGIGETLPSPRKSPISRDAVDAAAAGFGAERGELLNGWRHYLSDANTPKFKILKNLSRRSHRGGTKALLTPDVNLPELNAIISELGEEVAKGGLPGIVVLGDKYEFRIPFLRESLSNYFASR